MEQKYERLVPLFIDATLVNETIIDSILGQLSDGWWENSPKSQGLWINVKSPRFTPDTVPTLHINKEWYCPWDDYRKNPYVDMNDKEIRKFFANKVKTLVIQELKHNYIDEIYDRFYTCYGLSYHDWEFEWTKKRLENKKLADTAIEEYLKVNPFRSNGAFNETNDLLLDWLSRGENKPVTVADAYKFYTIMIAS